jgi:hypothetical protein
LFQWYTLRLGFKDLEKIRVTMRPNYVLEYFSTILVSTVGTIGRVYLIKIFKNNLEHINASSWSSLKLEWITLGNLQ